MDPPERRGYGSYLSMSVCVASSFNFSLFPSNAKTLSYTQRSASYHLYHYPAWHRDWLLPYHMADWILCAAGGFAGGFLCSVCTLSCCLENIERADRCQIDLFIWNAQVVVVVGKCSILLWTSNRDYWWFSPSPHKFIKHLRKKLFLSFQKGFAFVCPLTKKLFPWMTAGHPDR